MTEVTCHNCDYEWDYSGSLKLATCSSCGLKTPVPEDDTDDSE
jgi:hypothetical protein